MEEHNNNYRVRSPHRLILVLFALLVNFLLWGAFYSIFTMRPDFAAELAAVVAFFVVALVSFVFKGFLEE